MRTAILDHMGCGGIVLGLGRGYCGGVGCRRHGQFGALSLVRAPQSTSGEEGAPEGFDLSVARALSLWGWPPRRCTPRSGYPGRRRGDQGAFTSFTIGTDVPAFLRKGALEALGGRLDLSRDLWTLLKQGVTTLLRVNRMGRYFLSAVDFREDASRRVCGPVVPPPYFEWERTRQRPNSLNGGLYSLYEEDGLYQFAPPCTFTV